MDWMHHLSATLARLHCPAAVAECGGLARSVSPATVVIAVVFLWDDAQYVDPLEHYGVSGWYQVMYYGMNAAGAIVVPWFIVRLVWLLGRRGVHRILARTRAA